MFLTLRGTPTLYYGDEIGLENGDIRPDQVRDPQGRNLGVGRTRDVARTPMQWDGGRHAGFSASEPWLPISADHRSRNVAVQAADPRSMLSLYRRLLALRRASAALMAGRYRPLPADGACFVYWREARGERRLIALNFTAEPQAIAVPGATAGQIVLSTYLDREERVDLAPLTLRPHEGVILAI
jgi:alpha-glucosidase